MKFSINQVVKKVPVCLVPLAIIILTGATIVAFVILQLCDERCEYDYRNSKNRSYGYSYSRN
jgi:hypothetical protein